MSPIFYGNGQVFARDFLRAARALCDCGFTHVTDVLANAVHREISCKNSSDATFPPIKNIYIAEN